MDTLFHGHGYKPAMFSLAMSRDVSKSGYGGSLTIGGVSNLTDPRVNAKPKWTYTPIIPTALINPKNLTFYTIEVARVSWGQGHDNTARHWAVDSGTSVIITPPAMANAYHSAWKTKPTFHPKLGIYTCPCDAVPAPFSLTIAGTTFSINPKDMIQPSSDDGKVCMSSILPGSQGTPLILGAPFLKNVVAVFDWGKTRMGFTARMTYQS